MTNTSSDRKDYPRYHLGPYLLLEGICFKTTPGFIPMNIQMYHKKKMPPIKNGSAYPAAVVDTRLGHGVDHPNQVVNPYDDTFLPIFFVMQN